MSFFTIPHALFGVLLAFLSVTIDHPVTDNGTLSPSDRERVASQLVALRERTGVQMAVLYVNQSINEPIEDFSHRTAMGWRGGEAGRDNGLLLTFALADRQMRLEVGRGLEDAIPDEDARAMLDSVRPLLRERQYADAALSVIEQVSGRIGPGGRGERPAWITRVGHQRAGFLLAAIVAFLAGGVLGIYWEREKNPDRKRRRGYAIATFAVLPIVVAVALGRSDEWLVGYPVATAFLALLAFAVMRAWTSGYGPMAFCAFAAMIFTSAVIVTEGATPTWSGVAVVIASVMVAMFAGLAAFFPGLIFQALSGAADRGGVTYGSSSSGSNASSWWSSSGSSSSSYDYSSSSSSSSSSYSSSDYSSSSSSYSSSDYSGGGGDFGGGGASSGW